MLFYFGVSSYTQPPSSSWFWDCYIQIMQRCPNKVDKARVLNIKYQYCENNCTSVKLHWKKKLVFNFKQKYILKFLAVGVSSMTHCSGRSQIHLKLPHWSEIFFFPPLLNFHKGSIQVYLEALILDGITLKFLGLNPGTNFTGSCLACDFYEAHFYNEDCAEQNLECTPKIIRWYS